VNVKNDKRVSKPWAAHTTPSQLQDTGSLPGSQPSTCLEMHRSIPNGPHMAVCSILKKTNYGLQSWTSSVLERCQDSAGDGKRSDVNDKTNKKAKNKEMVHKMPSQIHEEGNLLIPKHSTCIKAHKMTTYEPQMAVLPIQQQPKDGSSSQGVGGLKLHHHDAVDEKRLKANVKTIKNVSEHGTMHDAPSIIHNEGDLLIPQHPMHSKMHNESMHSPQSAVSSSLLEGSSLLLEGSSSQSLDGMERRVGDILYEKCSNTNIGPVKSIRRIGGTG